MRIRWIFLIILSGLLAGIAAAVFLILLNFATNLRDANPVLIWFLPLAGLFIGWVYHHHGKDVAPGTNLILDEIHNPKKITPVKMAPFILIGTVLTHLFGGSAGREGTAVQMGASLADQLTKFFHVEPSERKILLVCGAGAGFGAAIGAPWAGMIFGMEVIRVGRLRPFAVVECFIASFVGYYTTVLLQAPHSHYPHLDFSAFDPQAIGLVAIAGIIFGLTARGFIKLTHFIEKTEARFIKYPPLKPFIGGLLLVALFYIESSYRYVGLGIPFIQDALVNPASIRDPILKTLFTSLTIGSGFKGGEFIPLVFIGTTLGSALSIILPTSFQLLASVGFAAVFAGAANTPIACTVMAIEIFGWRIGIYALIACVISFYCSGKTGIYRRSANS